MLEVDRSIIRILNLIVLLDGLVERVSVFHHELPFERAELESLEERREVACDVAKLTRALLLCPRHQSFDEFLNDWIVHVENLREMRWTGQLFLEQALCLHQPASLSRSQLHKPS